MRFPKCFPLVFTLCVFLMLTGCGSEDAPSSSTPAANKSWAEIEQEAQGSVVRFYMWGGSAQINSWVDGYVRSQVKALHGITLERVPMDASVFVNKLLTEKAAGKQTGTIDILWINGENFKNAREADLLYGPFAASLPNATRFVDPATAATDFGFPVEGYEAPYGKAQFVFEYDSARSQEPPRSFAALTDWVQQHPGRFTYPQPPDFTGSAFIRQAFYAVTGGHEQYMKPFDQALFDQQAPKLWAYLNKLEPYLWQQGRSYPKDPAFLTTLFARSEVDIMMAYHPAHAQGKILEGTYPETVRTFIMQEGSLFNTHFTAIPANAPNKSGAQVVINFLLSPEAQLHKLSPANWGDFPVLDMKRLSKEHAAQFAAVDIGITTLPPATLDAAAVPEIPSAWVEALELGWEENVLRK